MSANSEIWQVMIQGEVYEADMESLKQWVVEGRVLPTDKVRKGNLSWIQADRAPAMRPVFSGEVSWQPSPAPVPGAWAEEPDDSTPQSFSAQDEPDAAFPTSDPLTPAVAVGNVCYHHPQALPEYVCCACGATLCRECPKYIGTSKVALCPLCGELCQPYQKLQERGVRQSYQRSGFGFEDFGRAIGYPLKNIFTLVAAALFYSFLLLAGFYGQMVAYMILFGCISLVINRVSSGKIDRNFMPDFSSFSWWDDLFMPGLLGVGITIVTAGPMIVLILALWFGVIPVPGPLSLNPAQMQDAQAEQESQLTQEDFEELMNGTDAKKSEEAANKINQLHPAHQMNKEIEKSKDSSSSMLSSFGPFLAASAPIILLFLLALAWAVFYYPMALAVAGYTEDFWSTVNPLIGLNTIRLMGMVYVKAFLMYLCIEAVGFVVSMFIHIATAPFDMPFVGNLPARFLDGMVTFYINLVIACLLGLALYKCADKLDIPTD
jgi:uncharacterized membrane protein (DUF106 family)